MLGCDWKTNYYQAKPTLHRAVVLQHTHSSTQVLKRAPFDKPLGSHQESALLPISTIRSLMNCFKACACLRSLHTQQVSTRLPRYHIILRTALKVVMQVRCSTFSITMDFHTLSYRNQTELCQYTYTLHVAAHFSAFRYFWYNADCDGDRRKLIQMSIATIIIGNTAIQLQNRISATQCVRYSCDKKRNTKPTQGVTD